MSEIHIIYSKLEDAVGYSKETVKSIDKYKEKLNNIIKDPINRIEGEDSYGYLQSASSRAAEKIDLLESKKAYFNNLNTSLTNLVESARNTDSKVSERISTVSEGYVEERKWYEAAGDFIYNTFCVDLVNHFTPLRDAANVVKWVGDKVENVYEDIHNWFKYGDGKYVWNIVSSVVTIGASIVGAAAAVVVKLFCNTCVQFFSLRNIIRRD